ncbi:MAG: protein kinase [Deltaproteobacteria bacterium]|nr:protein kinase [Deltaproteobacteria bacterium]
MTRSRAYSFALDERGEPIELGSGRYAKAYLGEETWLESKTAFRRKVAIKILQRGVSHEDAMRFQVEKDLLERVQGHPNIIHLFASGEGDNPEFIPPSLRGKVLNDFLILELCDISLEERLKGTRLPERREDLLGLSMRARVFRSLDYMIPLSAAVEYAQLARNICHRDIKPANVLLKLPDRSLAGSSLDVRLADFNVGKVREDGLDLSLTQAQGVPGTIFFQSPEQEINAFELLVNVTTGSREVEYYEAFYIDICKNDTFEVFNRAERYRIVGCDRAKKKLLLDSPFREPSESNVRGKVTKSVDRPADIYALGALFYYLVSGAYANPKSLYDAFRKFLEYDGTDDQNTVDAYIDHEYGVIENLRTPRPEEASQGVAPANRFFSYRHYLDGNGELIDREVMKLIARAMIRNKRDSFCQAWDVETTGISELVATLRFLYDHYGVNAGAKPQYFSTGATFSSRESSALSRAISKLTAPFVRKSQPPRPIERAPDQPRAPGTERPTRG